MKGCDGAAGVSTHILDHTISEATTRRRAPGSKNCEKTALPSKHMTPSKTPTRVAVQEAYAWVGNLSIRRRVSDVDLSEPGRAWTFRILARNPSGRDCRICETGPQSAWHQPDILQALTLSFVFRTQDHCSPTTWMHSDCKEDTAST